MTVEQLLGVNDFNQAVGFWTDADGNNHGFTYNINTKQFTDDNLGFVNLTETAINNKHETAGFLTAGNGQTIGFIKNPNSVFPVPVFGPAGATSTQVLGLNDFDQAVGMYTDSNGSTHGFLFDEFKNLYYTIDSPFAATGKGSSTVLNGINDRFQAVGFYLDPAGHTDGLLVNIRDTSLSI